jgi:hypothetical protein
LRATEQPRCRHPIRRSAGSLLTALKSSAAGSSSTAEYERQEALRGVKASPNDRRRVNFSE